MLGASRFLIEFYTVPSLERSLAVCPPSQAPGTDIWMLQDRDGTRRAQALGSDRCGILFWLHHQLPRADQGTSLSSVSSPLRWEKCSVCLVTLGGSGDMLVLGSSHVAWHSRGVPSTGFLLLTYSRSTFWVPAFIVLLSYYWTSNDPHLCAKMVNLFSFLDSSG